MICVFPWDATDFSGNGAGMLSPSLCTVTETLNGEYELTLEHPLDDGGKWQRLQEGRILRVPVPAAVTPQVRLISQESYQIYKTNGKNRPIRAKAKSNGKILAKYKKGKSVIILSKGTTWYKVTGPDGKCGYMNKAHLTYVETKYRKAEATGEVIEPQQLRDQPFRIYRIVPSLDKVTVYARHIFYDLLDNMVRRIKPASTLAGSGVVDAISSGCLTEHEFDFYSDLASTSSEMELENVNPVDAIMGDGGLLELYGGELARDWYDVYLVQRVGDDTDIQIREGKNLLGVSYDVDTTDVVTRIMPTGEDKDGNTLWLPEVFIDSPHAGQYIHPKWIHLAVSDAREVAKGDGKKTKAQCYTEMRNAANREFQKGVDLPTVTLTVDFINTAETEEYRDYHLLQNIYLGDAVRVVAPRIGISVSLRLTQYTYDCLIKKYTSMTLGTVADTLEGSMISSRQIPAGSISGAKLAINSVGSMQLRADSILAGHVSAEAITTEKLAAAAVTAEKLAAGSVDAGALSAIAAKIGSLTAGDIATDTLAAGLAAFTVITCGTAGFDRATVTHLVTQALNLSFGVGDDVMINNLRVAYAQVVAATIGNLCVRASDGSYYTIDVDASGNVTATPATVTEEDISAGETDAGRVILETDILAANLSTTNLLATYALVNRIDAARIDVDQLFAREAFIAHLRTSEIVAGKSLTIIASEAAEAREMAETAVAGTSILAKTAIPASCLIVSDSAGYFRLEAGSVFDVGRPILWAASAIDANATAATNYMGFPTCTLRNNAGSSWTTVPYATLYLAGTLSGNSFSVADDNWLTTAPNSESLTYISLGYMYSPHQMVLSPEHPMFRLVNGVLTAVSQMAYEAQVAAGTAQATADAIRTDFQRVVRIDDDGLHIGDNLSNGEVLIDSESVNVVLNGRKYSKFAGSYVQFGNYQLRRSSDGGLVFKLA